MRRAVLALLVVLVATPAWAHGAGEIVFPSEFLSDWHPPIWILAAFGVVAAGYGYGYRKVNRRTVRGGRTLSVVAATAFYLGLSMFALALASPLESLTGTLLSAHMIQHVILIALAPPLLLAGRPDVIVLALLGPRARRWLGRRFNRGALYFLLRPIPAAMIHGAVILIWHLPPLFDAALFDEIVHDFEHLTFVLSALLFWYAVFAAERTASKRIGGLVAILITMVAGGALGALLTFSTRVFYGYGDAPMAWDIAPLTDQQLAGLIMWIPASLIYLTAGLVIALSALGSETDEQVSRLARPST